MVTISVHVDDLWITGNDQGQIFSVLGKIKTRFDVRESNILTKFLGISITDEDYFVKLHHTVVTTRMLKFFNISDCNASLCPISPGTDLSTEAENDILENFSPYPKLVCCFPYLSNITLQIYHMVRAYCLWVCIIKNVHWIATKGILSYLRNQRTHNMLIEGCIIDNIWFYWLRLGTGEAERKSASGYVFIFSNEAIIWGRKKQSVVAQSTVEV